MEETRQQINEELRQMGPDVRTSEARQADQRRVQIVDEAPPRREEETRTAGCTSAPIPVGFLVFSSFSVSLSGLA
jgi:hypothetical protein